MSRRAVVRLTPELEFEPYEVCVCPGGTVVWAVDSGVMRCIENEVVVTSLSACTRVGDSPPLYAGDSWELVFEKEGVYSVDSHTYGVKGRVIVEDRDDARSPTPSSPPCEAPLSRTDSGEGPDPVTPSLARAPSPGRPPRPPTLPPPAPVSVHALSRPRTLSNDASSDPSRTPNVFTVRIRGYQFVPTTVRLPLGGVVRWTVPPDAEASHVIEAVDYCFESPVLQPGSTFEHAFSSENGYSVRTIRYTNSVYPFMKGEVSILPPGMDVRPPPSSPPRASRADIGRPAPAVPPRPPSPPTLVVAEDLKAGLISPDVMDGEEAREPAVKARQHGVETGTTTTPASAAPTTTTTTPAGGSTSGGKTGKGKGSQKEKGKETEKVKAEVGAAVVEAAPLVEVEVDPAELARQAARRKKRNIKRSAARARARARARALSQSAGSSVDMTTSDSDFGGLLGVGQSPAMGASELAASHPELQRAPQKRAPAPLTSLSASASSVEVSPSEKSLSPPVTATSPGALLGPPMDVRVPPTAPSVAVRVPASSPSGTDEDSGVPAVVVKRSRRARGRRPRNQRRASLPTSSDPESQLSDVSPSVAATVRPSQPPAPAPATTPSPTSVGTNLPDTLPDPPTDRPHAAPAASPSLPLESDNDDDGLPDAPVDDVPPPLPDAPTDQLPPPVAVPARPTQAFTRDPVQLNKAAEHIRSLVGLPSSPRASGGGGAGGGGGGVGGARGGPVFDATSARTMFQDRWRQTSYELDALRSLTPLQRKNLARSPLTHSTIVIPSARHPHTPP